MWVLWCSSSVSCRNHKILLLAWSEILRMGWVAYTHDRLKLVLLACEFGLVVIILGTSCGLFEFFFSTLNFQLFPLFHALLWSKFNLNTAYRGSSLGLGILLRVEISVNNLFRGSASDSGSLLFVDLSIAHLSFKLLVFNELLHSLAHVIHLEDFSCWWSFLLVLVHQQFHHSSQLNAVGFWNGFGVVLDNLKNKAEQVICLKRLLQGAQFVQNDA